MTITQDDTMLKSALAYAQKFGWRVFPCEPGGKEPVATGGQYSSGALKRLKWKDAATNDPAKVKRLWQRWGMDCNIGLACGPSGLVVIDLDVKPEHDGRESWRELCQEHGINDDTTTSLTGGGGTHLVFAANGANVHNSAGKLGPGVDVKADGGYIVLPPSVHPDGPVYAWDVAGHPLDRAPAPLPPALLALLGQDGRKDPYTLPETLPEGIRDRNLFRLGCKLRAAGMGETEIAAAMRVAYQERADHTPEYTDEWFDQKAAHICKTYSPGNGNTTPTYTPQTSQAGAVPDNAVKQERQARPVLMTQDYLALFDEWGYTVKLNLANDDIEVNGTLLSDVTLDTINSKVRDYGTREKVRVNVAHAAESLTVAATQSAYHPVKQYLEKLTWDGQDHIHNLAARFFEPGTEKVFHKWLFHWLIGAVAKVYDQFQNPMFVLDSKDQGIGKSYFARWLCPLPGYFNASAIQPENKDHRLRLLNCWVWEVEELGTTTRKADVEALKAFITLDVVRERKAYGRRDIRKPALASFLGTINSQSGFLVDRSGNRRFLVCTLDHIEWEYATSQDVNQVWAQAMHVYRSGQHWKLTENDVQQRDRLNVAYMVDDPVESYLESIMVFTNDVRDWVTNTEIDNRLQTLGIKVNRGTSMTVASVLKSWGAEKGRRSDAGKRERGYGRVRFRTHGE